MIAQELFQIWHHIIGALEQHLWYIVDDNEAFLPSLRVAISLNERQYDELLQRSAFAGNEFAFCAFEIELFLHS